MRIIKLYDNDWTALSPTAWINFADTIPNSDSSRNYTRDWNAAMVVALKNEGAVYNYRLYQIEFELDEDYMSFMMRYS